MKSLFLPSFGATVRFHDLPGREPVRVFIHGLGSAASADLPEVALQPPDPARRWIAPDLLGFGFSDAPADFPYTIDAHARVVAALLDQLQVRRAEVLGHSMGGSIAIELARERPDLVSALAIAEGNLEPGGGFISEPIATQSEDDFTRRGHQLFVDRLRSAAGSETSLLSYIGTAQRSASFALHRSALSLVAVNLKNAFLALDVPRAFITGARSAPEAAWKELSEKGIPVLTVPNAGHAMFLDNPGGFACALEKAFSGDSATATPLALDRPSRTI